MGFVPQAGHSAGHVLPAVDADEMVTFATMRLVMPDRLIPASLDIDGIAGLERRLRAGANVVTSIVPPDRGARRRLPGDARHRPGLSHGGRRAAAPRAAGAAAGRRAASTASAWRRLAASGRRLAREAARSSAASCRARRRRTWPRRPATRRCWWTAGRRRPRPASPTCTWCRRDRRRERARASLLTRLRRRPARVRGRGDPRVARRAASRLGRAVAVRPRLVPRDRLQAARRDACSPSSGVRGRGDWPACGFPAVVKPSTASGSEGVVVAHDEAALAAARARPRARRSRGRDRGVRGRSVALPRGASWGGRAVPLQVTGLEFDAAYDCKRVVAPVARSWPARPRRPAPAEPATGRPPWLPACSRPSTTPARASPGSGARRPHGRRGHGARRRAQGDRDRRPAAQPDAHGGLLVERPQHRGAAGGDGAPRAAARRRPHGPARLRLPARARRARYARGARRARDGERPAAAAWCPASSAPTMPHGLRARARRVGGDARS